MRAHLAALSAIVLVGCSSIKGEWDASCSVSGFGMSEEFLLNLDLETQGKEISGDCTLAQAGILIPGTVTGTANGPSVDFTCNLAASGYSLPLSFAGDLKGDAMDGTCSVTVSGYTVTGTGTLSRP